MIGPFSPQVRRAGSQLLGGQPPSPSHLPFLESQAVPFPVGDFLLLLLTDE